MELELEPEEEPTTDSEVFYNEDMIVNRDISVASLAEYQERSGEELKVCDALSASGVRGLRYLNEVDGLEEVLINDIKPEAVENIQKNLELNGLGERAAVTQKDANLLLTENFRSLDYVDIDPFGSPTLYLDSTARSLRHESAAGFTATDLGPLYGSYPKVCERRYSSRPLKVEFGHELGIRILIKETFRAFSRYDRAFEPVLAWHEQHYSRVFGTVEESKKQCNRMLDDIGYLSFCRECRWRAYEDVEQCSACGGTVEKAGPLWTGKLADDEFAGGVRERLDSQGYTEAEQLIEKLQKEADISTPFYESHEIASSIGVQAPERKKLLEAVRERGFRASQTHFSPQGFRTDAPIEEIREAIETTAI